MIYTPSHFKEERLDRIHSIMERFDFATLITVENENPIFSHLPFLLERGKGKYGTLYAHMARANPHWRSFHREVRVLFQGPHAYVSPTWYEEDPSNVPTWNYAVVHANGIAKTIESPELAVPIMKALIKKHDPDWTIDFADKEISGMLNGIVVFEIAIQSFDAKFKLSQNRSETDRKRVGAKLLQSDSYLEHETGRLLEF